jgi:hypothetical protein
MGGARRVGAIEWACELYEYAEVKKKKKIENYLKAQKILRLKMLLRELWRIR